jgi:hypothetical protein
LRALVLAAAARWVFDDQALRVRGDGVFVAVVLDLTKVAARYAWPALGQRR